MHVVGSHRHQGRYSHSLRPVLEAEIRFGPRRNCCQLVETKVDERYKAERSEIILPELNFLSAGDYRRLKEGL